MNNIYVIFYFINIFATQIYSFPTAANVYDVVSANFSKNCPLLSSNVLVNSTTKYLSNCKDITLLNPPERIATFNINKFYCIGTLVADLQLCNSLSLSKHNYKLLPKNLEELESHITGLQQIKPADMCTLLKNIGLFNDTTTIPTLSKTVTELKQELEGPHCKNLCSELINEEFTNVLCSMMFYIHSHINNVTLAIAQQKPTVVVSNEPNHLPTAHETAAPAVHLQEKNAPPKHDTKVVQQTANEGKLPKINEPVVDPKIPVTNQELPTPVDNTATLNAPSGQNPVVVVPSAQENELISSIKHEPPVIPSDTNKETTKQVSAVTVPSAVGEIGDQPPIADIPQRPDHTSLEKAEGEEKPIQTKNTNETPTEIKTNVDQNIGSVFLDEKDTPPTSTESNKQNSENIDEYTDEEDIDDGEGLKIDEPKPKAEKSQEEMMNSRADINPNINQVIDDDVEESNFFSYFMFISVMFIAGYVVYHNKQKIMALVLEGRRDRNSRRRPSTSSYRKLNSNLEEAVTSKCSGSASHVIY